MSPDGQAQAATVETVQSADDTTIAFDRSGHGPALILVAGAFCDRSSTKSLAAALGSSFTVYEYDRRGRGDSGDAAAYSIEREVEDLRAVVDAAGGSAFVFGHSSGAALALEAAARVVAMRKLVVYEPPYITDGGQPTDFADQLRRLVASGHRAEAVERFIASTGAPAEVVGMMKSSPYWATMLAIAHTLANDVTLGDSGSAASEWLARVSVPTLAVAGGASPDWAPTAARTIAATAPDAQDRILEGQDHNAPDEVIAPLLREFFA